MLTLALWIIAAISPASGAQPNPAERAIKVVLQLDSPELPPDASDRHPRTVWRVGKNRARIEGVVSADTGHRILVVADSPHLWVADLDTHTGYHTVDTGPEIGASVPVFPESEVVNLEIGNEAAYFEEHGAKSAGRARMNGKSCERQDIETETYLLIRLF